VWDTVSSEDKSAAESAGLTIHTYDDVIAKGKDASSKIPFKEPNADSVYMFSYTSGTTGDPKAVKMTHRMAISVMASASAHGIKMEISDSSISYLPLAHSME